MKSDKIAVLISGGLDSAILAGYLLKSHSVVQPIYLKSGHVWEHAELFWLKHYLKKMSSRRLGKLVILSFETKDLYDGHWSLTGKKTPNARSHDKKVYLPGKNLLLIAKASVYCSLNRIPTLALGPLKTNPFPDASASFFKSFEKVCSEGLNFKLKIKTPFLNWNKTQVMKLGQNLPLHLTFSCLNPPPPLSLRERDRMRGYFHCGNCNKCAERKKAFKNSGIPDLTRYAR